MENTDSINIKSMPRVYGELWSIAENYTTYTSDHINPKELEKTSTLFIHPLQIEDSIRGNNLFEYFKEKNMPICNAVLWDYLRDNQKHIPESWKFSIKGGAQYIFFWGTIDRGPDGNLYVRYLTWSGGNWTFGNFLLSGNWHEDFPALILS